MPQFNWDDVPEQAQVDSPGLYPVEVGDYEWQESQETGKVMVRLQFQVTEGEKAGAPIWDRFVFGSADDPKGLSVETWLSSIGTRRLRDCLRAAQSELSGAGDPREVIETALIRAKGSKLVLLVKEDKRNPGYFNVARFYPAGYSGNQPRAASPATATGPRACPICNAQVDRAAFAAHVAQHGGAS
jgi:hypothetical protein